MMVINGSANRNAITDLRRTNVRALVRRPTARTRMSLATASAMEPLLLSLAPAACQGARGAVYTEVPKALHLLYRRHAKMPHSIWHAYCGLGFGPYVAAHRVIDNRPTQ